MANIEPLKPHESLEETYERLNKQFTGLDTDVKSHKASNQAHSAADITYDGKVVGAGNTKQAIDNVQEQVNTLVLNGDSSAAAAQAAIDADGHNYGNLKLRLDTEHTQLSEQLADKAQKEAVSALEINKADKTEVNALATEKADVTYVTQLVASVSDGTPEAFENLAAIIAAYPSGESHVKLNLEDGYVYKWNGAAWEQGWKYQETGIGLHSVTPENTTFIKSLNSQVTMLYNRGMQWNESRTKLDFIVSEGALSCKIPLLPFQAIKIKFLTPGNRFFIGVSNVVQTGTQGFALTEVYGGDPISEFNFRNLSDGKELYLYLNSGSSAVPSANVKVDFEPLEIEFEKPLVADKIKKPIALNEVNFVKRIPSPVVLENRGFGTSGGLRLIEATNALTYKVAIEPYQIIEVKASSPGDRFQIAVSNTSRSNSAFDFYFDKTVVVDNSLTSYTYQNDADGKELYVYVRASLSTIPKGSIVIEITPGAAEFSYPVIARDMRIAGNVPLIKGQNLWLGEYSHKWMTSTTGVISTLPTITSAVLEIELGKTYRIHTEGVHNRFLVGLTNSLVDGAVGSVLYFNQQTLGNENYEFTNTSGFKYLLIGLSNTNQTPSLLVTDYDGLEIAGRKVPLKDESKEFGLKVTAIADTTRDSLNQSEVYPTLLAIKTSNAKTKALGYNDHPRPVGWLYYYDDEPYKLLYANGKPDNIRELCTWNKSITYNGMATPKEYAAYITKDGDILCVYRGEQVEGSVPDPTARKNPIIYPNGDYNNPVEIDFGSRIKPTSWLQNCGADYLYNQDCFIFTEYTRPVHEKCYVWKVTKPFTNPDNWRIVKEFDVSGHAWQGFKHAHTINFDPYSERVYLTTGDDDSAAAIYESSDYGETWAMKLGPSEKYCRLLNFVFTEDKIYWASDSGKLDYHSLFEISRDVNGVPDFTTLVELWKFPYREKVQATYVSVLVEEPNGILFLDRFDNPTTEDMKVYFWSFETESAHTIHSFKPLGEQKLGFRCEATNWYQAATDSRIVSGFGYFPNEMDVLGNTLGPNKNRVCNLSLEVVRKK